MNLSDFRLTFFVVIDSHKELGFNLIIGPPWVSPYELSMRALSYHPGRLHDCIYTLLHRE